METRLPRDEKRIIRETGGENGCEKEVETEPLNESSINERELSACHIVTIVVIVVVMGADRCTRGPHCFHRGRSFRPMDAIPRLVPSNGLLI